MSTKPVVESIKQPGDMDRAGSSAAESNKHDDVEPPSPTPNLVGEALVSALKAQLNFYFSKSNLQSDAFLISQMNAQKYVPVEVICNFRKIKSMSEDIDFIVGVMKTCKNLEMNQDFTQVRPVAKMERTTLILRDIPASVPSAEVKAIFDFDACPAKVVSLRSDIGDTWFVTFANERECQDVAMSLMGRTFNGKVIRARIKSENLIRGYYIAPGAPPQGPPKQQGESRGAAGVDGKGSDANAPGNQPWIQGQPGGPGFFQPNMGFMNVGWGGQGPPGAGQGYNYMYPPTYNQQWNVSGGNAQPGQAAPRNGEAAVSPANGAKNKTAAATSAATTPLTTKAKKTKNPADKKPPTTPTTEQPSNKKKKNEKATTQAVDDKAKNAASSKKQPDGKKKGKGEVQPDLGEENFPSLPTTNKPATKASAISPSKYEGTFHKFTREDMVSIVEAVCAKPFEKPASYLQMEKEAKDIFAKKSLMECQLPKPFPIMYPASPSPIIQPESPLFHSIPSLDLNSASASAEPVNFASIAATAPAVAPVKDNKKPVKDAVNASAAPAPPKDNKKKREKARRKSSEATDTDVGKATPEAAEVPANSSNGTNVNAPSFVMGAPAWGQKSAAAVVAAAEAAALLQAKEAKANPKPVVAAPVVAAKKDEKGGKKEGKGKKGKGANADKDGKASQAAASQDKDAAVTGGDPAKMSYAEMARRAAEARAASGAPSAPSSPVKKVDESPRETDKAWGKKSDDKKGDSERSRDGKRGDKKEGDVDGQRNQRGSREGPGRADTGKWR